MSKFIRAIGRCSLNNRSAEMYKESRGVVNIKILHGQKIIKSLRFETQSDAENWLDRVAGEDTQGAVRLNRVLSAVGIGWE